MENETIQKGATAVIIAGELDDVGSGNAAAINNMQKKKERRSVNDSAIRQDSVLLSMMLTSWGRRGFGEIPEGTPVNMSRIVKSARQRFSGADAPLAPPIPDEIIQKAIFSHGFSGEDNKTYQEETAGLRDTLTKGTQA